MRMNIHPVIGFGPLNLLRMVKIASDDVLEYVATLDPVGSKVMRPPLRYPKSLRIMASP